jgi:hypothetical protein
MKTHRFLLKPEHPFLIFQTREFRMILKDGYRNAVSIMPVTLPVSMKN